MASFRGLSLDLRGWEVVQKQIDRCSDTKTDVQTNIQMFGHTDGQTNRWDTKNVCLYEPYLLHHFSMDFKTKHKFGILMLRGMF